MAYFSYMKNDAGAQRIAVENGPLSSLSSFFRQSNSASRIVWPTEATFSSSVLESVDCSSWSSDSVLLVTVRFLFFPGEVGANILFTFQANNSGPRFLSPS